MAVVTPESDLQNALASLVTPGKDSHKGQNGKILVIGGSTLFHASAIWAAAVASRIVDMVHYSSTAENNEIFKQMKASFVDGIVVPPDQIDEYVKEDDCILIGPGFVRGDYEAYKGESEESRALIERLMHTYRDKKFVLDAGALQIMDKEWLNHMKTPAIVTPHIREFERLFGISANVDSEEEKKRILRETAAQHNCVILLKHITDYVADKDAVTTITGGNEGLAKGGTGDVLAGLTAAFYATNDYKTSCIISSYLLKSAAESLYEKVDFMYNATDLIYEIGRSGKELVFDN